jgi:pimeloyl-ACP methyl ester carboxylesterase
MSPVKERIAHVGHRTMRYLEAGDGRPLLLLHSFPLCADQWKPQLENVPAGWRFVAPDLFGLGPAARDADDVRTMAAAADDVLALMDRLELQTAAVAGVSMGGYVALALLRQAAARLTALVLADTRATPDTPDARDGRDRTIAMVERDGVEALAREMLPKLVGETSHRERPAVVSTVTRLITGNSRAGVRAALEAIRDRPDSTPLLATIQCPTLILCGAEDTITPLADSDAMHGALAGSHLVVLPAAGHLSNLENAAAFNRALEAFLT